MFINGQHIKDGSISETDLDTALALKVNSAGSSNVTEGTTPGYAANADYATSAGSAGDADTLTGVLGSDLGGAGTVNGILKADGAGQVSAASAGTDYLAPSGNGSGLTNVVAATLPAALTGVVQSTAGAISAVGAGGVADSLLTSNVPLKNAANVFTANQTVNGTVTTTGPIYVTNTSTNGTMKMSGLVNGDLQLHAQSSTTGRRSFTLRSGENLFHLHSMSNAFDAYVSQDILTATHDGKVGIGTASPAEKLDVNGKVKAASVQLTTDAGAGKVLTSDASGNGAWVLPFAQVFNVKAYGATGDGTTNDTAAIQAAIDAASAAGGGTVHFPESTYIVKPGTTAGLVLKSNVNLTGEGTSSILKIASDTGDWFHLLGSPTNTLVENVTIRDLAVDCNAAGNTTCEVALNGTNNQIILFLIKYKNIVVENCQWTHSGVNAIALNGAKVGGEGAFVRNNRFHFVPGASGGVWFDNSAVYLYGTGLEATGNRFTEQEDRLGSYHKATACIEVHRGPSIVSGNVSEGYQTLANVCSTHDTETETPRNNHVISGNTVIDCLLGINLWTFNGYTLRGVVVSGNAIYINNATREAAHTSATYPNMACGIVMNWAYTTGTYDGITITGNSIVYEYDPTGHSMDYGFEQSHGVFIGPNANVANVMVDGNSIQNAPLSGVMVGGYASNTYKGITVQNNVITNAGQNAGQTYEPEFRSALSLGQGIHTDVTFARNTIIDTNPTTIIGRNAIAIDPLSTGTVTATRVLFTDNKITDQAASAHLKIYGTAAGVTVKGLPTALVAAPSTDLAYDGTTIDLPSGEALAVGNVVYLKSDGKVWKADADAEGLYPAFGLVVSTASAADVTTTILLRGIFRDDSYANTVGGVLYLSATPGAITQTVPSGSGTVVQVLGIATHADRILFQPSLNTLTLS